MEDVFTSADIKAQEVYVRTFKECFPNCGVIGEEAGLRMRPRNGCRAHFTVDPIDGTRAYIRRQSHGVSTMVALVLDREVISAYIGDINADEVYGYRPGSNHVHRITRLDRFEVLTGDGPQDIGEMHILLRDPPQHYGEAVSKLLPRFKNFEIMGSSVGTWMARLWKREIGAALLLKGSDTPWDSTPIIGISRKLGYAFLRPMSDGAGWEQYEPVVPTVVTERDHDILVIHESNVSQL
jgi:fructose-1,6-bisphosphatase/inositol monophosphatase family enzyme